MAKSKTQKYYDNNPEAKEVKDDYNSKYQKKRAKCAKLKVKSHKTGKEIQYKSDLKNREREDKKKGIDTSEKDYDHTKKKRIPKSNNRGNKKQMKFRLKVKQK